MDLENDTKRVNIVFDGEIHNRMKKLSKNEGRTIHGIVNIACEFYLKSLCPDIAPKITQKSVSNDTPTVQAPVVKRWPKRPAPVIDNTPTAHAPVIDDTSEFELVDPENAPDSVRNMPESVRGWSKQWRRKADPIKVEVLDD